MSDGFVKKHRESSPALDSHSSLWDGRRRIGSNGQLQVSVYQVAVLRASTWQSPGRPLSEAVWQPLEDPDSSPISQLLHQFLCNHPNSSTQNFKVICCAPYFVFCSSCRAKKIVGSRSSDHYKLGCNWLSFCFLFFGEG